MLKVLERLVVLRTFEDLEPLGEVESVADMVKVTATDRLVVTETVVLIDEDDAVFDTVTTPPLWLVDI